MARTSQVFLRPIRVLYIESTSGAQNNLAENGTLHMENSAFGVCVRACVRAYMFLV